MMFPANAAAITKIATTHPWKKAFMALTVYLTVFNFLIKLQRRIPNFPKITKTRSPTSSISRGSEPEVSRFFPSSPLFQSL